MIDYLKRNLEYARYIVRHKWFVFQAGRITKAPLWRLLIHDWSKLTPSEWPQYRDHFYPPTQTLAARLNSLPHYHAAWQSHLRRNGHHWQYWVNNNDDGTFMVIEMPEPFVREMVADWCGAGRAITGKWEAYDWYAKHEAIMKLHSDTRTLVVQILDRAMFALTGPTK